MRSRQRLEIARLLLLAFLLSGSAILVQASQGPSSLIRGSSRSTPGPEPVSARLSAIIASGRLADLRWPNFSDDRPKLFTFYRPTGYTPAWISDEKPTSQALELIRILQNADDEGLRAEDYDASRWADRVSTLRGPHDEDVVARFDAALTVCVMRYLSDLQFGRINPQHLGFEFGTFNKKFDIPQFVRDDLVAGSDLHSVLAEVGPPFAGYRRLLAALPHYEDLAGRDTGEKLPPYIRALPGQEYANLKRLASLLRLLGDLPADVTIPSDSTVYRGPLVDAVERFQRQHGLPPSGIVDKETIAELNVPLSKRVEQIRLGLERYRWLPYRFSQPPIVINIPEFRLYGFDERNQVGITMNVNVGDQYDFQTPIFEKDMLYVVFRPYWFPPPAILRNEITAFLKQNPSLDQVDLELVNANGQVIRSGAVTPAMMQQIRAGQLTVRQEPGPDNALGLVKFIFPNDHHVYLHDTPASEQKFSPEKQKVFSHGCIHAEQPAQLAAWVLRNTPGWNLQRVEQAMHGSRDNLRVNLASPIPVLIVYQTAVVEEDGEVHFFRDIYGHDAALERALTRENYGDKR